jgi:hypothetical protein
MFLRNSAQLNLPYVCCLALPRIAKRIDRKDLQILLFADQRGKQG